MLDEMTLQNISNSFFLFSGDAPIRSGEKIMYSMKKKLNKQIQYSKYNMPNFEVFCVVISSSINLLFLKSVTQEVSSIFFRSDQYMLVLKRRDDTQPNFGHAFGSILWWRCTDAAMSVLCVRKTDANRRTVDELANRSF